MHIVVVMIYSVSVSSEMASSSWFQRRTSFNLNPFSQELERVLALGAPLALTPSDVWCGWNLVTLRMACSRALSTACTAAVVGAACAFVPFSHVSSAGHVCHPGSTTGAVDVTRKAVLVRGGSAAGTAGSSMTGADDLYVVGAGYLGKLIGQQWRAKFPSATVYAETRSTGKHEALEELGFTPTLRGSRSERVRCPNVVFCAAPSGNDEYEAEVAKATSDVWDNSGAGTFVFTSSGGIYAESDGGTVNEDSAVSDKPRAAKLRGAEAACLGAGGCIVRFAGLYSVERGPHNFWLQKDELDSSADGLINLLAYEDAASAVVSALETAKNTNNGISGRIFLAADSVPTTRRDICEKSLQHPFYEGKTAPRFNADAPGAGATKVYDTTVTRRDLAWQPRYESFGEFMSAKASEERN